MNQDQTPPSRDNFFEALYSKLANLITPYLLNFTPNQITIFSGILGVVGALLLYSDNYLNLVIAAIFIQLFSVLDLVDGNIARKKNLQSKFGMWTDVFFDKFIDFLIIFVAPVGIYIASGDSSILIWGIILMGSVFFNQIIMILNSSDQFLKSSRTLGTNFANLGELKSLKINYLITIVYFFRKHLSYQHNTFLFLISFFALIDQVTIGIYFLTVHSVASLILSILINFIKIKKN